ncbi:dihydrolipoyl dehydrogenase [Enterococcus rivorum]|uniref:Dihydrolipoyl dehydrogenase n=1 Tax=Enterococcus rivorum TaxID=762845 RepID=A0A1E5KUH9_9ENTE|nr:dihydrolipoyl dehydrogenase [Enterococcus rivorum]MBP2099806.1 dihydrolipoamide dehydrogenase [Enterococcus rivorum]OEH81536.1 dihydrolipoyl dehydrogenase [Enterococcus rivorum]
MKTTEVLVIGSGPGGYVAAIRAAQLGKKVTIVEAEAVGGVCLNVGCIPSKALITAGHRYQEMLNSSFLGLSAKDVTLDFTKTQQWKNQQVVSKLTSGITALLKKNQVTIVIGQATFISKTSAEVDSKGEKEQIAFQQAILATGSRPIEIKGFPFGGRILDSTGGLNLTEIPKNLIIIGGGYIGCELAGAYANLGSKVTLIEGSPSILPSFEEDIQELVNNKFKKNGVTVEASAKAISATQTADQVCVEVDCGGKRQKIDADYVMVTVGRKANTDGIGLEAIGVEKDKHQLIKIDSQYRTTQPNIFAIGDIVPGLALAHKASYDGKVAAEVCAGKQVVRDYRVIPAVCFTDPEIAVVGLTKKEAIENGIDAEVAVFPMQANGRALSMNEPDGFIRLVFDKADQSLLGAQIVGVNASELIAEITIAIETFLTLEDVALTIHGHPTVSETIMDACEVGLGIPIHM